MAYSPSSFYRTENHDRYIAVGELLVFLKGAPRFGVIVLQNPKPGTQGNLGQYNFQLPGVFRFDANLSKNIKISETKSLQFRMDASNVLNHPNPLPAGPAVSINSASGDFGYLTNSKTGNRQFQGQLRAEFLSTADGSQYVVAA